MNNYQEKWESRSSIRTRPRKTIEFSHRGYFFPPSKQALLLLPEVIELGEEAKTEILLHTFYKYLNDIVALEIRLISAACNHIIYDDLEVHYSEDIKLNAHTVIIDEYYHVYIAQDMIRQLDRVFPNFKKLTFGTSDAYYAVATINNSLAPAYRGIFEIIAVCIFETTLVRELVEFFNDKEVHPSIRHYVNDHMNDESKHYHFFYELLETTWSKLPINYQENIGIHLGNFVKLYLNISSEKQYNFEILNSYLQDSIQAKKLIDKIYEGFDISAEIPIVKNVLSVLKNTHIMDCSFVQEGFIKNNLYV